MLKIFILDFIFNLFNQLIIKYVNFNFRFQNPYSSGVVPFSKYQEGSFLIVANLEKMKITDGAFQVKLSFANDLQQKLVFIWMPVYERRLIIDKNLDVAIE